MGDYLKHKIQRRPDRQELIQQHILEDTTVDPNIHERQRQLKKARLADDLNDRLSHRPGPLELIKGNILRIDEPFAQAIKEGQIQFKKTCEGEAVKHPPPRFVIEEESSSDTALSPPQDATDQTSSSLPSPEKPSDNAPSAPIATVPVSNNNNSNSNNSQVSMPTTATAFTTVQAHPIMISRNLPVAVTSNGAVVTVASSITPTSQNQPTPTFDLNSVTTASAHVNKDCITISKSRKKSKSKTQPKARTIKFHEYKVCSFVSEILNHLLMRFFLSKNH